MGMVKDRAPHQLNRLLRGVVELLLIRSTHNELRRWRIPDRRVLACLPEPGRIFLSDIPAGLMLEPIMSPSKYRSSLVPDDLLMMEKTNPQQAIEDLTGELRGVPYICHL